MKLGPAKSRFWSSVAGTVAVALAAWLPSGEAAAAVTLTRVSNTATQTTFRATGTGFTAGGSVTVIAKSDTVGLSDFQVNVTADSSGRINLSQRTARHNPNACTLRVLFRNNATGSYQSGTLGIPSPCKKLALSRSTSNGGTISNFTASNIYGGRDAHVTSYWEYMDIDHGPQLWGESYPGGSTWRFTRNDYWDHNRLIRMTVVDQLTGAKASVTYRPIF